MVWRLFDEWFDGASHPLRPSDSIPTRLEAWAKRINRSPKDHMARTLPYIILWYLWAERNNSRHNGVCFRAYNVVWQVRLFVQKLVESGRARAKHFKDVRFEGLTLPPPRPKEPTRRVVAIKWHPPDAPWFKLNVMGRYDATTDRACGGGIIRDHLGNMVGAFFSPIDAHSELEAELDTTYRGMAFAERRGALTWVELSSQQVKKAIEARDWGPAACRHTMVRIQGIMKEGKFKLNYVHPESNKVAEYLAKLGKESTQYQEVNIEAAPRLLTAMVRLERLGVPNIRLEEEANG